MKFTSLRAFSCVILFAVLAILPLGAQTPTSSFSGVVQDESGAVIPAASVVVKNRDTGISRNVTTDGSGRYHVPGLIPGIYEVQAQMTGFETGVRTGVQLTIGNEAVINMTLKIGQVSEKTVVTADAPLLETTNSSLSGLVDDKTIRDLPLNGRSFDQLISLESSAPTIHAHGSTTLTGMSDVFSVNGARTQSNMYLMDGTELLGAGSLTTLPGGVLGKNMGVDAVREFTVLSSNYSAAYGKRAGGVINIATRSGTNQLHGSGFEFLRNSYLDARDFFDGATLPPFRRNQFGGALGGPIKKDKAFFFGTYEGLREAKGLSLVANVPSADARLGKLPGQADPIPVNPVVKPYLDALYPLPNGHDAGDGTGEYSSSPMSVKRQDFFLTRVDYSLSDKDSIFARLNSDWGTVHSPDLIPIFAENDTSHSLVLTVEEKRISPRAMNVVRFGFTRARTFVNDDPQVPLDPNLRFLTNRDIVGQITFSASSLGGSVSASGSSQSVHRKFVVNDFDYSDQVFLYRGAHSFQFGAQLQRIQHNENFQNNERATFLFADLKSFLMGTPTRFTAPVPPSATTSGDATKGYRQFYFDTYVQDDYKVRPNLTLNLGLRYEMMTVPIEASGNRTSNYRTHFVNGLQTVDNLPTIGAASTLCPACPVGSFFKGNHDLFAPRVGFAWDVSGNGKTSIRGGFGMFYDSVESEFRFFTANNVPFFGLSQVSNGPFPLGFATSAGSLPAVPAADGLDYNFKIPTRLTYSLSLQRQVASNIVVSATYSGSSGYHLTRDTDNNTAIPTFQPDGSVFYAAGQSRINPKIGNSRIISSDSISAYHSLQLDFTQRVSHGMRTKVSYTFSKSTDDTSVLISQHASGNSSAVMNPFNFKSDKGLSAFDVRNNIVGNFTYDIPGKVNGPMNRLVAGWQLGGIVTLSAGSPFTVLTSFSRSRDQARSVSDRPNLLPGAKSNHVSGTTAGCPGVAAGRKLGTANLYYDPCVYSLPTLGTYGNLGRDTVIGPGFVGTDFTLVKVTPFTERFKSEFRFEVFNMLNRANFGIPSNLVFNSVPNANGNNPVLGPAGVNPVLGTAGRIQTTTSSSRQIQFGLKLLF